MAVYTVNSYQKDRTQA